MSLGTGDADCARMKQILEAVPEVEYICVDVANGYSEHFVQFVKDVRRDFPKHTIIVSLTGVVGHGSLQPQSTSGILLCVHRALNPRHAFTVHC